jgi:hypothetical protein
MSQTDICESFTDVQGHRGFGCGWNMKVCVVVSKSRLCEHILLFNSWSCRCPSCPSSPPSFLHTTFVVRGTRSKNEMFELFFPLLVQLSKEKQVKLLKIDFQKNVKRTHFSGVVRPACSSVFHAPVT